MSAWGLARQERALSSLSDDERKNVFFGYLDRVVQWIPADVLAVFGFAVTALHHPGSQPSVALLIIFTCLTPVVVLLGFSLGRPLTQRDIAETALSIPAFVIWSSAIPESGWWRWHLIANHPVTTAIVAAVAALLFSLVAQGVERRADPKPIRRRSQAAAAGTGEVNAPNAPVRPLTPEDDGEPRG